MSILEEPGKDNGGDRRRWKERVQEPSSYVMAVTHDHVSNYKLAGKDDEIAIFVGLKGEPLHQFGPSITLHFDAPFYVGIGFCSHLRITTDTAVFSNVVFKNASDRIE